MLLDTPVASDEARGGLARGRSKTGGSDVFFRVTEGLFLAKSVTEIQHSGTCNQLTTDSVFDSVRFCESARSHF